MRARAVEFRPSIYPNEFVNKEVAYQSGLYELQASQIRLSFSPSILAIGETGGLPPGCLHTHP